jgi:diacylglycerol kinase
MRLCRSPTWFPVFMLGFTTLGLGLDSLTTLRGQLVLAACTWVMLIVACVPLTRIERAQVLVVVVVATGAELIGSVWWGVYDYRLGNLPLFVPPGHGLVYLTGLRISQAPWIRRHATTVVYGVAAVAVGWALLGLTALPQQDVAGAIGVAVFLLFLVRGRAPLLYAGVFMVVFVLEIYGTAIGTWRWAEEIPGLGIPDGNPPSGAVAGYVFFDICALALAPAVVRWFERLRDRLRPRPVAREGPGP